MKLNEAWLRQWVNAPLSSTQLSEQLTLAGLETDIVTPEIKPFHGVVVGEVTTVAAHPNADRLKLCTVDCGIQHIPQKSIICGATNVRKGLRVATALPGASLPGDMTIQARTMRGVESQGMLCSVNELGLDSFFPEEATAQGIWELPQTIPLGTDLWKYLNISDPLFEIQIPPNRGDCLSVAGIAREVAALNRVEVTLPVTPNIATTFQETWPVTIEAANACPRYTGRVIRGLNRDAKTPLWMADRLRRSGIRTVNAIVDITNYVLLEWGAPLHAFDLNTLSRSLTVRFARADETLQLLNDKTIELTEDTLVIADQHGPQALAGIMGGAASAVSDATTDIFLESAFFKPTVIAGRARRYGLMTDASYRFERGVDPELCRHAMTWATHWLLTICGGQAGPMMEVEDKNHLPQSKPIEIRTARFAQLLGIELSPQTIRDFLMSLGVTLLSPTPEAIYDDSTAASIPLWRVKAPSWRFDLNEEVDFIEECARLYGYDNIPTQRPHFPIELQPTTDDRRMLERCRLFWMDQGYHETVHYSFTAEDQQQLFDPAQAPVCLENPISAELNVLRTNLWPGLMQTFMHNRNYQQKACYLFEMGTVFSKTLGGIAEEPHMGGIAAGQLLAEQWGVQSREIDFFDVKQTIHNSFAVLDAGHAYTYVNETHPALHPSQSARIYRDQEPIGWVGALHPQLYDRFDVTGAVYLFEWRLMSPLTPAVRPFQPFSRFPLMRRDVAFWVSTDVPFEKVESLSRSAAGEHLKELTLFDVYQPKDQQDKRSLALGLVWQHPQRTLTDTEVDEWQANVMAVLQAQYQVEPRG